MENDPKATTSQISASASSAEDDPLVRKETVLSAEELAQMMEAAGNAERWQDYTGFTPELLQAIEAVAATHYNVRRYKEAEAIFSALNFLEKGVSGTVWRGLGACRQTDLDFEEAIPCYGAALMRDVDDHLSYVRLSECLLLLGRRQEAISVLEVMLQFSAAGDEGEVHVKRARAMLQAAQQNI